MSNCTYLNLLLRNETIKTIKEEKTSTKISNNNKILKYRLKTTV